MVIKIDPPIRPLDLLNSLKYQDTIVLLKDGKKVDCQIVAFDIHINLIITEKGKYKFIKGSEVLSVESKEKVEGII